MKFLLYYLIFINVLTFIFYGADKRRAVKHKFRISEATLLGLTFIGGSVGALAGMMLFHHKTKKPTFIIAIPLTLVLHAVVIAYLMMK